MAWIDLLLRPWILAPAFSLFLMLAIPTGRCGAEQAVNGPEQPSPGPRNEHAGEFSRFRIEFEPDAYYTNLGLYIALTEAPIPYLGEKTEQEIYLTLLSRFFSPRFLVLEASINPLPYLGAFVKKHSPDFYEDAQWSDEFNWIETLTAGFEEPYAASVFVGDIVDFNMPGQRNAKRKGYIGYLVSAGNYHIKSNTLIQDDWREVEAKIKGDKRSDKRKLSWSFRIGAKFHGNPDIADIMYLSFRRSRTDYLTAASSIFNNSGFEYTLDLSCRTLHAMRHYFTVDKKWPLSGKAMAFSFAVGFIWESSKKYTGPLAGDPEKNNWQLILRPNIEF